MFKFNNWDGVSKISIDKLASLIITDKSVDNINSDKLLYNYIPTDVNFTILDFGCGIGRNTLDIANKFPNVTIIGYDNSSMLSRVEEYSLRRYNKKLEEYKNVQLISDWAFIKNIKFDFIFATLVFQHINEDDLTVYLNDIRNMTDKLLVSGRRFNDESVNGIYKNTWEILQ